MAISVQSNYVQDQTEKKTFKFSQPLTEKINKYGNNKINKRRLGKLRWPLIRNISNGHKAG